MNVFDEMLAHNAGYAQRFDLGHLQTPPARKLVILTCMDSRMDLEQLLGLRVIACRRLGSVLEEMSIGARLDEITTAVSHEEPDDVAILSQPRFGRDQRAHTWWWLPRWLGRCATQGLWRAAGLG